MKIYPRFFEAKTQKFGDMEIFQNTVFNMDRNAYQENFHHQHPFQHHCHQFLVEVDSPFWRQYLQNIMCFTCFCFVYHKL